MTSLKPAITQTRKDNRSRIFQYIYHAPEPVAKQAIAYDLGFSLPTIHKTISELLEAGLILPGELQPSTGGRRATGYVVNSSLRYALGISLTKNQIRLLASDLSLSQLSYKNIPLKSFESKEIGRQLEREWQTFLQENQLDPDRLLGIGITLPGVIDREKDQVVLSPTLQVRELSLGLIRDSLSRPVYFENESTASGFAEWLTTENREDTDFVYLSLENGVGGALFLNGKPCTGRNGRSGEFGHMTLVPGGRLCNCGKKGCVESYLSMFRIQEQFGESVDDFFRKLEGEWPGSGENASPRVLFFRDYLDHLSLEIHNLRMTFDCDVVLGGAMVPHLTPYLPELRCLAAQRSPFADDGNYLRTARFPVRSGMMGVAWHFIQEFLDTV